MLSEIPTRYLRLHPSPVYSLSTLRPPWPLKPPSTHSQLTSQYLFLHPTRATLLSPAITFINLVAAAPFSAIRSLFNYLAQNLAAAAALNNTYPLRGVFKTAAFTDPTCDQKLTIDLSPTRAGYITPALQAELTPRGLANILSFFATVTAYHVPRIMDSLSPIANRDLVPLHAKLNVNFRIIDYTPATASPASQNRCGAHTDYGTFSIIFQDGAAGLEIEAPEAPSTWIPVSGDATVLLCGWCAVVLSGGRCTPLRPSRAWGETFVGSLVCGTGPGC